MFMTQNGMKPCNGKSEKVMAYSFMREWFSHILMHTDMTTGIPRRCNYVGAQALPTLSERRNEIWASFAIATLIIITPARNQI